VAGDDQRLTASIDEIVEPRETVGMHLLSHRAVVLGPEPHASDDDAPGSLSRVHHDNRRASTS
jgi:hypothetical protein